jgi:hypothetical protein
MRPIGWGLIFFLVGIIGWLLFSIIGGIGGAITGGVPSIVMFWVVFFGVLALFSLPIAVIIEIVRWIKRKKE